MIKRSSIRTSITQFENRSLVLFAALALGATSTTWAQSTAAPMSTKAPMDSDSALVAMFSQADKDADKALSPEEAKTIPALAENFDAVDGNGDGLVSEAEFITSMAPVKQ